MREWPRCLVVVALFLGAYLIPFGHPRVQGALLEALLMLQEYAREHVLFCLVPAFFIAGAVANFVSQGSVIRYFGGGAPKWLAYAVASVSGAVLAVCSCTVLPLFAGIHRRGAGIGPAIAFLYSGPAVNVLAIILTARVLGWQLGVARAVGAVLFAIVIGLTMAALYHREEAERARLAPQVPEETGDRRRPWQDIVYFVLLLLILITAAWGRPAHPLGFWAAVYAAKWHLVVVLLVALAVMLHRWFAREELGQWVNSTWEFARQILPLLGAGVLLAGLLMGRPASDGGLMPSGAVTSLVGGNSLVANLVAALAGAFMYFATLTEVPILQGLIGSGMGQGPALALLLAGPALSLPNMLVIRSVIGIRKTLVFVLLVVTMATISGLVFGQLVG
ncbi:MAG: permease [bacterium]|nr:permease [bacterium]